MEMVEQDFFNYMYNGIVNSSAIEIIAFLMVVGGAFGIMIRTGAIESGLIGLIRKDRLEELIDWCIQAVEKIED